MNRNIRLLEAQAPESDSGVFFVNLKHKTGFFKMSELQDSRHCVTSTRRSCPGCRERSNRHECNNMQDANAAVTLETRFRLLGTFFPEYLGVVEILISSEILGL